MADDKCDQTKRLRVSLEEQLSRADRSQRSDTGAPAAPHSHRHGASPTLRLRLRDEDPPRPRDLPSDDDDDQLQAALLLSDVTADEEFRKWGDEDQSLEEDVKQMLLDQGIESLDDLVSRELTDEDFEFFVKTGLLTDHKCHTLKVAVDKRRGAAVSHPARSREETVAQVLNRDHFSADADDQEEQLQLALRMSLATGEFRKWGEEDESLEEDVQQMLLDQGIESLDDLVSRELTDEGFEFFVKAGLLTDHKCHTLKVAVEKRRGAAVSHPARSREETDAKLLNRDHFSAEADELQFPLRTSLAKGGEVYRFLLVGKTGGGKSTTGNAIFGEKLFLASLAFSSVTSNCQRKVGNRNGRRFEILDCPGLFDTNKTNEKVSATVIQAVAGMHPGPHAILYVIRLGRFTAEEFGTYTRLKSIFNEDITGHMIIVFTGGDELEREEKSVEELLCQGTPKELQQVIKECNGRYTVFNNMAKDTWPQTASLLSMVDQMMAQNKGQPYACPMYASVGENLEKEVARRLEKVEKKDLKRQEFVLQLERRARKAEAETKELKEQHKKNEQNRQRRMKDLNEYERLAQMKMIEKERRKEMEELGTMMELERKLSRQLLEEQREKAKRYDQEMEKVKMKTATGTGKLFFRLLGAGVILAGAVTIGGFVAGPAGVAAGAGIGKGIVDALSNM